MTPLDKIIYFADMIGSNRNYLGVEKLRNFAETSNNLDEIILKALDESIIFVMQKNLWYTPTLSTPEIFYSCKGENKNDVPFYDVK